MWTYPPATNLVSWPSVGSLLQDQRGHWLNLVPMLAAGWTDITAELRLMVNKSERDTNGEIAGQIVFQIIKSFFTTPLFYKIILSPL